MTTCTFLFLPQTGHAAGDPATYLDDTDALKQRGAAATTAQTAVAQAKLNAADETRSFAMIQGIDAAGAITTEAFQAEQLRYYWTQMLPAQAADQAALAQASADAERGKRDHRWTGAPNLHDLYALYQAEWQAVCNNDATAIAVAQADLAWREAKARINEELYAHRSISEAENLATELAAQLAGATLTGAQQLQAHCEDDIPTYAALQGGSPSRR